MSDPLEDMILKQNWSAKFSEALENKAFWDNTLNGIVKDGMVLFGEEKCRIYCASLKHDLIKKLKGEDNVV